MPTITKSENPTLSRCSRGRVARHARAPPAPVARMNSRKQAREAGIAASASLAMLPLFIYKPAVTTATAFVVITAIGIAREINLSVEVFDSKVYLQWGSPAGGTELDDKDSHIEVRHTGNDVKGYGAFAKLCIPRGTKLGEYEGEVLSKKAFFNRYPDGFGSHCVAIDCDRVLDGKHEATKRSDFTPAHINHSRTDFNVVRQRFPKDGKVVLYALHDIEPGSELLLNYGSGYWRGREDEEQP